MVGIVWRDSYKIGVDQIDAQHKKLLLIINDLYEAHKRGTSQTMIIKILNELVEYTNYHFTIEEDLFKQYDYPQKDIHLDEHRYFVGRIAELQQESKKGNLLLSLKTIDFLKDWTINHILGTDKEFGNYINENEIG